MRLTFKQLKKMTVETLSGATLGRVHDIIFDTEGQNIIQYMVKAGTLSKEELLISRDQVVRFEEKKMTVYDTAARKKERNLDKVIPIISQPETNIAMRNQ